MHYESPLAIQSYLQNTDDTNPFWTPVQLACCRIWAGTLTDFALRKA